MIHGGWSYFHVVGWGQVEVLESLVLKEQGKGRRRKGRGKGRGGERKWEEEGKEIKRRRGRNKKM